MKFSVKPFSKGRRVPVAHKQGADRSGSGDFAGVNGTTSPSRKCAKRIFSDLHDDTLSAKLFVNKQNAAA